MKRFILLSVIYLTFIALGLPDALIGSSWNAIRLEFDVLIRMIGWVTFTTYVLTILATYLAPILLKITTTQTVASYSVLLSGASLIGMSFATEFYFLVLLAILLGLGAGAIDLSINHYVTKHLNQSHMSFLHTFYGVGVMSGPFIMAITLNQSSWRLGMLIVGGLLLLISLSLLLSKPVWEKESLEEKRDLDIGFVSALTTRGMKQSIFIFVLGVHIESFLGLFIATYTFVALGFSAPLAALSTALFYLGLTLGRLTSGLLSHKMSASVLILIGESLVLISAIFFLFTQGVDAFIFIFLIGLGMAPVYPNMMYLNKTVFPSSKLSRIMSLQMMIGYVGFGVITPLLGALIDQETVWIYPYIILLVIVILLGLSSSYHLRFIKKSHL